MISRCLCYAGEGEIEAGGGSGREIEELHLGSAMATDVVVGGAGVAGEGERPSGEAKWWRRPRARPQTCFYRAETGAEGLGWSSVNAINGARLLEQLRGVIVGVKRGNGGEVMEAVTTGDLMAHSRGRAGEGTVRAAMAGRAQGSASAPAVCTKRNAGAEGGR